MKRHIVPHMVLTALAAAVILLSAAACSDRSAQARLTMSAADSLMTADPQAALDTIMTIDSADAAGLPRADRALYTLLRTEAEYKCYMPVAGNTTISEAVDYYRRKGPEDRLARALTMQGAVLTECGDPNGRMFGMTKTLADICYIYEGSHNMPGKVEDAVKSILSDEDTLNNVLGRMLELTYPGFMTGLSREYPSLNDSDRKLIVLTCCGFSSSTASVILGISVQNLNARKYRIARKMGIDGRISSFMKRKLSEYSASVAKPA